MTTSAHSVDIAVPVGVPGNLEMKIACENIILEGALLLGVVHLVLLLELHVEAVRVLIEHFLERCQQVVEAHLHHCARL